MRYDLSLMWNGLSYNDFHSVCKNEFQKAVFFYNNFFNQQPPHRLVIFNQDVTLGGEVTEIGGSGGF